MTGDNTLLIWDIAIQLEEPHKTCRRSAVCPPLQYWFVSTGDRQFSFCCPNRPFSRNQKPTFSDLL